MNKKTLRLAAAAGIVAGAAFLPATSAHAEYPTTVGGQVATTDPGAGTAAPTSGGNLPTTGSDAMAITLVGGGLAAGGAVLVAAGRRRRAAAL